MVFITCHWTKGITHILIEFRSFERFVCGRWYYLMRKKIIIPLKCTDYDRIIFYQCLFPEVTYASSSSLRYSRLKIYIFFLFNIKKRGDILWSIFLILVFSIFLYNSYIFLSVLRRSYLTSNKFIFIFVFLSYFYERIIP